MEYTFGINDYLVLKNPRESEDSDSIEEGEEK